VPASDLRFETDPRDPAVKTAMWVLWHARAHLYESGPGDRHYVVERARGLFRFPGTDGFIPPAGCPIAVTYVTGGGTAGNVATGLIRELHSGVGFVESVTNPLAASGGAAAETLREARDRSTQAVRNRGRAVSAEDFEWLAREASAEVARARALPLEGASGRGARGFVGLVLVPQSADPAPLPSPELCARVLRFLGSRVPAGIAGGVRIVNPAYVSVGVRAEIIPRVADEAGRVEARVRARLNRFLHPLAGGRDGFGWDFGVPVYLSDIAALLEDTPGVDAVGFLQLMVGQALYADLVPVEPHQLVAAGDSQLKIIVPSVPYALA
jgi:predicted phage baseplate assembly protein